jgi:V/A-type H+/Na+-transporting ATPase subunit E
MDEMKTLDQGQDKIKKISEALKNEIIGPAKKKAEEIIEEAKAQAAQIIAEAEQQADKIHQSAKSSLEKERNVFQSSLVQASKQSVEALRQSVEHKLFNEQLHTLLDKQMTDPNVIAKLITAIIHAIESEGVTTDIVALIPNTVAAKEINRLLADDILKRLKDKSVQLGGFTGGAQVKLEGKKLTIDISDSSLQELLASYVRKDFRKLIFTS